MSAQSYLVPISNVLKEGSQTRSKEDMRNYVMAAAEVIYSSLKPCLGPNGRMKILMDTFGDVTISGDGAGILSEVDVEHPVAKVIVESAKAMDKELGDGIVTMVVLCTKLLLNSRSLLEKGVHPSLIVDTYMSSLEVAKAKLSELSKRIDPLDKSSLSNVVKTSMSGYINEDFRSSMVNYVVDAALKTVQVVNGRNIVDLDRIKVEKKSGGAFSETLVLEGVVLDKEIVHPAMPKLLNNVKAALLDVSLEVQKTEFDEKLRFKDPMLLQEFINSERSILEGYVQTIKDSGAKVVFCQKGIDDFVQYLLAKEGIMAIRRIKKSDMEKLALSTGGKVISSLDELNEDTLGIVRSVEERRVGGEKWVFVEGAEGGKVVSILLRGPDEKSLEEAEKVLKDGLSSAKAVLEEPYVVPGAGAIELEIATSLMKKISETSGQKLLAYQAFAGAFEDIPRTLAHNAGLDPEDTLTKLVAKHSSGLNTYGVGDYTKPIIDSEKKGIIEPTKIKKNIYSVAVETAIAVLRIDEVIAAAKMKTPKVPEGAEY
ncbi:MAG: thermosome subunit beta [Thermoproteota archaeon]